MTNTVSQTNSIDNGKTYTKTVRELLGWDEDEFSDWTEGGVDSKSEPEDLPTDDAEPEELVHNLVITDEDEVVPSTEVLAPQVDMDGLDDQSEKWYAKDIVRYPVIFIVALGFFYVLLNFGAVFSQVSGIISSPPDNEEVALGESLAEYNTWISKYYYHVSDLSILAANNDADGDGLTNVEEFRLNSNPLRADTDIDGIDDGTEIAQNLNPLYKGAITASQQIAVAEYIDVNTVMTRKSFTQSNVAGASFNQGEYYDPSFVVDTNREGWVSIPKIGSESPLVWNKNFEWVQDDLKHGVIHHPDTSIPGQYGMVSIHGHSSGYVWDGNYKNVFTKLNFLEAGDEVFVTVYGTNGQERIYRYVVETAAVYEVEDSGQFASLGGYHMNLSTSWPIGTAKQRYVVTTKLQGIVK